MLDAMIQNADFMEFSFPARIAPPLLTRYTPGMHYGLHPDAAYIPLPDGQLRTDVSCTIFLSDPADYDGGALHVQLGNADLRFKEAPGVAIVYPSHTLHEVEPVTRGARLASFFWVQSLVRQDEQRNVLLELDDSIQALRQQVSKVVGKGAEDGRAETPTNTPELDKYSRDLTKMAREGKLEPGARGKQNATGEDRTPDLPVNSRML